MSTAKKIWSMLRTDAHNELALQQLSELLSTDTSFSNCLFLLSKFPAYLRTPLEAALSETLSTRTGDIDDGVLAAIGDIFIKHWRRSPPNNFWYGDLRQSLLPFSLQKKLCQVTAVHEQLLNDFCTIAPVLRSSSTVIGCRRLERAGELLLHHPQPHCREKLLPLVQADWLSPHSTRPLDYRYENVYWSMLRILRALGENC
jgi:hypothetical protein